MAYKVYTYLTMSIRVVVFMNKLLNSHVKHALVINLNYHCKASLW